MNSFVKTSIRTQPMEKTRAAIEYNFISEKEKADTIKAIIKRATRLSKINSACIGNVDIRVLDIDTSYRNPRPDNIVQLHEKWNPVLMPPLIVSYRDSRLYLVDGINRVAEANYRSIQQLPAVIFTNLTKNDEISIFLSSIRSRNLNHIDEFNMQLLVGNPIDTDIKSVCDKYSVEISDFNLHRGIILSNTSIPRKIIKDTGKECLDWIFALMDNAGWLDEPGTSGGKLLRALHSVYKDGCQTDRLEQYAENLLKVFRKIQPETFKSCAIIQYPYAQSHIAVTMLAMAVACGEITLKDIQNIENQQA